MSRARTNVAVSILLGWLAACWLAADAGAQAKSASGRDGGKSALLAAVRLREAGPRELALGGAQTGQLTDGHERLSDGSPFEVWQFAGRVGDLVVITMRSSDFDPYLMLGVLTDAGVHPIADDDDGGGGEGGRDAAVVCELPYTGRYVVLANAATTDAVGDYGIELRSTPLPTYPGNGAEDGRYALLLGIGDYPGAGEDLDGPRRDVELFGALLVEDFGFARQDVLILTDLQVTRRRVAMALRAHLGQAGPAGVAVLYYSGHGVQLESNLLIQEPDDPEPDGVDEALVMADGAVLLDDELGGLLGELRAQRQLVVIDSCHSGTGTRDPDLTKRSSKELQFAATRFLRTPSAADFESIAATGAAGVDPFDDAAMTHVLLAGSMAEEQSWLMRPDSAGAPASGCSVFTWHLVVAMRQAGAAATFAEVVPELSKRVDGYTRKVYGKRQHPHVEGAAAARSMHEFLGPRGR